MKINFITFETVDQEIYSILIFLLASPPHFVCNFSRKIFPISYFLCYFQVTDEI